MFCGGTLACCDRIAAVLFTIAVVDYGNRGHENPTCPLPQVDRDAILSFSVSLLIYSFKFGYSYSLIFVSIHVIIDHHTTTAIIRLPCHYAWMIGLSQPAAEPNPCKQKPLHVCRTLQYRNDRVGRRDTLISSPDDSHVVIIIRPSCSGKVPACGGLLNIHLQLAAVEFPFSEFIAVFPQNVTRVRFRHYCLLGSLAWRTEGEPEN